MLVPHRQLRALIPAIVVGLSLVLSSCSSGGDKASPDTVVTETAAVDAEAVGVGVRTIDANAFSEGITSDPAPVLVDVRTPAEFDAGHIDGAKNIDFESPDFAAHLAELDKGTPYAIYCRSGNRSGQAAQMMRDAGFADVIDLDGGIVAWEGAGFPLVQ